MEIESYGITDKGIVRKNNEDSLFFDSKKRISIVTDGVGSHKGGKHASKITIYLILKKLEEIRKSEHNYISSFLKSLIKETNIDLMEKSKKYSTFSKMATTLNILYFSKEKLTIGHVGDTRTYLFYNDDFSQITTDHTLENYAKKNNLDLSEVSKKHNLKALVNIIGHKNCNPDIHEITLNSGQLFLTASDGLFKMLTHNKIKDIIQKNKKIPLMAKELIKEANKNGGLDNITVVLNKVS